jgi:transcriptional regulator with XRE-family HTH domain
MSNHDSKESIGTRSHEGRKLRIAVGERIEHLRKRKRWSQAELARRVGSSRTNLLKWEKGQLPSLGMLILLSEVLETTLDSLLAGRSAPSTEMTAEQRKTAVHHLNQLAGLFRLQAKK